MVAPEPIKQFRGDYSFLSNFSPAAVRLGGLLFPTVEHAFQAAKTERVDERLTILKAPSPSQAKRLGRALQLRPDWDGIRLVVMRCLLVQKFEALQRRERLVATHPRVLEEGNTWSDCFWGIDLRTGKGANHLGRLLMDLRLEFVLRDQPLHFDLESASTP